MGYKHNMYERFGKGQRPSMAVSLVLHNVSDDRRELYLPIKVTL
jgi:hypothetical protein